MKVNLIGEGVEFPYSSNKVANSKNSQANMVIFWVYRFLGEADKLGRSSIL